MDCRTGHFACRALRRRRALDQRPRIPIRIICLFNPGGRNHIGLLPAGLYGMVSGSDSDGSRTERIRGKRYHLSSGHHSDFPRRYIPVSMDTYGRLLSYSKRSDNCVGYN